MHTFLPVPCGSQERKLIAICVHCPLGLMLTASGICSRSKCRTKPGDGDAAVGMMERVSAVAPFYVDGSPDKVEALDASVEGCRRRPWGLLSGSVADCPGQRCDRG